MKGVALYKDHLQTKNAKYVIFSYFYLKATTMVMKIKHLFLAKDMAYVTSQTESNRTIFLSYIEEKFTKIEFYLSLSYGKTAFVKS
jgi:phosphopantetheinyl transferase (holo-ACP synthase)